MGGSVRGGHIHGQFPDILTEASDLMLSRGRIIPTSGWESMWYGISQWMGVSHENMLNGLSVASGSSRSRYEVTQKPGSATSTPRAVIM